MHQVLKLPFKVGAREPSMEPHTPIQSNRHRGGWTLIEMLTTIVVLSVTTFMVIPYATSGDSAAGQSVSRLVVSDILAAQMDAVATQGFRRIHFFVDGSGWCVEVLESDALADPFDALTAEYAEDAVESQGQSQQSIIDFSQDSRFRAMSISDTLFDGVSTSVIFDPTGGIVAPDGSPSTGGSFQVNSGEFAWEIQLAPLTGKVTVVSLGATP